MVSCGEVGDGDLGEVAELGNEQYPKLVAATCQNRACGAAHWLLARARTVNLPCAAGSSLAIAESSAWSCSLGGAPGSGCFLPQPR